MASPSSSGTVPRNNQYAPGGSNVVTDVNQIVAKNGSAVQGIQDQIETAAGELNNIGTLLQQTQDQIGQQRNKLESSKNKAAGLQQQMASLKGGNQDDKSIKDQIAALQPQLDAANADVAQQQQALDQLIATAQGLSDQMGQIKSKLDTLRNSSLPQAVQKDQSSNNQQVKQEAQDRANQATRDIDAAKEKADSQLGNAKSSLEQDGTAGFSPQQNVAKYQQAYSTGLQGQSSLDLPYLQESLQGNQQQPGTGSTGGTGTTPAGGVTT